MRTQTAYLWVVVLITSALLTRCNVFEGMSEAGQSNDPETLLEDAFFALQAGRLDEAIQHLEKALQHAPAGQPVRFRVQVALSNALLQKARINVLTLERLATDFNNRIEGVGKRSARVQEVCSFPAEHVVQQELTLNDLDGYVELETWQAVLSRVREITNEVLATTTLPFDVQARIAALQAQGLSNEEIAAALLNASVASVGLSFIELVTIGTSQQVRWYSVRRPSGQAYLGYCASNEAVVEAVRQLLACSVDAVGFSATLLQARVALLNNSTLARQLAERVQEAHEALEENLGGSCVAVD